MKIFNKHARFKYIFIEKLEAGVVLSGAEIKSIRAGRVDLSQSFARIKDGEVYLVNMHVFPWMGSEKFTNTRRDRKLLLHKKQIQYLVGKISGGNVALVPVSVYIKGNLAKVELALSKTKSKYDKRAALKQKTIKRDIEREVKNY